MHGAEPPSTSNGQPLVSVVTPFYNTALYLRECIESVLAQTYGNWEYLLFDNCSTDGSREIAEAFANKDARVRVISSADFVGQVQNYNRALRLISPESKYCKIVQADDWIYPECLEEMVHLAERHPSIGIVSSYYLEGSCLQGAGLPFGTTVMKGEIPCRLHLLEGKFLFGSPTSLMVRSDIVRKRDPFYSEGRLHEDTEACYEILQEADFGFVHKVLSFLRTDNVSITNSARGLDPKGLDRLIIVRKYGRMFLSAEEYQSCLSRAENNYFHALSIALVTFQSKEYWQYHRTGLLTTGYSLLCWPMFKEIIWTMVDLIFNPKKTLGLIMRKLITKFQ